MRFRSFRFGLTSLCGLLALVPGVSCGIAEEGMPVSAPALASVTVPQALVAVDIWRPRQLQPLFAEPGGTVVAEVRAPSSLSSSGWSAAVKNDLRSWGASIVSASSGSINRGTESGWKVTVRLPADVSPELLTLELSHSSGYGGSSPRSVSVVPDLETDFYLFHMTDEHAREKDASSDGEHSYGYRSAELVSWGAPAINLANPRFVLNTGDLTFNHVSKSSCGHFGSYGTINGQNQLGNYLAAKEGYRVASIAVPGNHDIPLVSLEGQSDHDAAAARWESVFGARSFSVRLGSFYVLAHDYTDPALQSWAEDEYAASREDGAVKFRLIAQHYVDEADVQDYPVLPSSWNLMLVGHIHDSGAVGGYASPVRKSWAAHERARAGLFTFERTSSGWSATNVSGYDDGDTFPTVKLVNNTGVPTVSDAYQASNNGTATSNRVSITNETSKRFHDGRVRFLMAAGSYSVTGGQKLAEYTYANGTKTAVLVKVNIAPSTTTQVSLSRSGGGGGTAKRFTAVADTFVRDGSYSTANYGGSSVLTVKDSPTAGYTREAFFRFDLGGATASTVSSATLRVYVNFLEGPAPLKVYGVSDDAWSETGLTWNTRPSAGSQLSAASVGAEGFATFDVTAAVASALAGDKKVSLVLKDTAGTNKAIELDSREGPNAPVLEVTP